MPESTAMMKDRRRPLTKPSDWEPVDFVMPEECGDSCDEFDISSAKKPVYPHSDDADTKMLFAHGEPDVDGEITNCFEDPGILYRIVDRKAKTWAFYNDSLCYEVQVSCTFGKHSKIEAMDNTQLEQTEDGEFKCFVVVYPGETEYFVKGFINGFNTKIRAQVLSDDYYTQRSSAQHKAIVQREIEAVERVANGETDAEKVLRRCLEKNIPFVDLSFRPIQSSIERGATKPFKNLPWARPTQYLQPELREQVRLFRTNITPGNVQQGELGDCWLMCAISCLQEEPAAIIEMFKSPDPEMARKERAIGAYRVTFNKNGVWRSVIVDDYLPVVVNTPIFARSADPCEIWPSILEKAFAKLHGSYALIQSGDPLHAISDMTGCPSNRFDSPFTFAEASSSKGKAFFQSWMAYVRDGYQIILTTDGKAPAIVPGTGAPDFSEEPEMRANLENTGLLPGHAYSVLDVREFEREHLQMVCFRNPYPFGEIWNGDWSKNSPLWYKYPTIARQLNFDRNDESRVWMPWSSVLTYFAGGGVLFRRPGSQFDYRIPFTFADCRPSVILQVEVPDHPVELVLSLNNVDQRLILSDADEPGKASDYLPLMLSVAQPLEEKSNDIYRVEYNSGLETTAPTQKWMFVQAREVSMVVTLQPSEYPYFIIPRILEMENTFGTRDKSSEDRLHQVLTDLHFANDYKREHRDVDNEAKKHHYATLGVRTEKSLAEVGKFTMVTLDEPNAVFDNFPKFPADEVVPCENIVYQEKAPKKCAVEKKGTMLE